MRIACAKEGAVGMQRDVADSKPSASHDSTPYSDNLELVTIIE